MDRAANARVGVEQQGRGRFDAKGETLTISRGEAAFKHLLDHIMHATMRKGNLDEVVNLPLSSQR